MVVVSVDEEVYERLMELAKAHGVSVAKLVRAILAALVAPEGKEEEVWEKEVGV